MKEIIEDDLIGRQERLLYLILQELKGISQELKGASRGEPKKPKGSSIAKTKRYACKICGKTVDNKGKYMAHMKKHKKEGGS